jgi:hypothetical protein
MTSGARAWCVRTNTGVWYGGVSPHQPFHESSGHGPRTEHVAPQNERAHIVKRAQREVVVDAPRSRTLAMHLLEDIGLKEPREDLGAAHAQRILQILARTRAETIEGGGEAGDSNFAHHQKV